MVMKRVSRDQVQRSEVAAYARACWGRIEEGWSIVMVLVWRTYTVSGINTVFVRNAAQKVLVLKRNPYGSLAISLQNDWSSKREKTEA